jgi:hypothetical protein
MCKPISLSLINFNYFLTFRLGHYLSKTQSVLRKFQDYTVMVLTLTWMTGSFVINLRAYLQKAQAEGV